MLIPYAKLANAKVFSLQLGGPIAYVERIIIEPSELKIVAFILGGPAVGNGNVGNILDASSIRELSRLGIIIDSAEELLSEADAIKIKKLMDLNFDLIGLRAITRKKTKLGKVIDYTVNSDNLMVQQIIVQRPAFKAIIDPELTIGRSEIVEVSDYEITIKDEEQQIKAARSKDFIPNFVNPFREPDFAKADSRTPGE